MLKRYGNIYKYIAHDQLYTIREHGSEQHGKNPKKRGQPTRGETWQPNMALDKAL